VNKLSEEILKADLFQQFVENMKDFEFEARKDVAQVLNGVMRHQKNPSLDYLKERPEILHVLVNGYSDPEVALNCGIILREVLRFKEINEILLHSKLFDQFFIYVQLSTFDIASDAFLTFKMLLTKHDTLSAKFCDTHYEMVFTQLNSLLESKNFVTKRQSLKLLSELLLSRSHLAVRVRYVNDANNLKLIMNLLRCSIKAVQYEAFHVFKIFVANPKKGPGVVSILIHNRERLIEFLKHFQIEKDEETFLEEKQILINTLQQLQLDERTATHVRSRSPSGDGFPSFPTSSTSSSSTTSSSSSSLSSSSSS